MWVFTKHGFFSIVQDKENENIVIIRARVKGDIEKQLPEARVEEDAGSDYRFRARLPKPVAAIWLKQMAEEIDYTNYKAAVNMVDPRRSEYYGMVWAIMADLQFEFLDKE
jgi:hypothetical protein